MVGDETNLTRLAPDECSIKKNKFFLKMSLISFRYIKTLRDYH